MCVFISIYIYIYLFYHIRYVYRAGVDPMLLANNKVAFR